MKLAIHPRRIKYAFEVAIGDVYTDPKLTEDERTAIAADVLRVGNIAAKCRNARDGMDHPEPLWDMLHETRPDLCHTPKHEAARENWIAADVRSLQYRHAGAPRCLADLWKSCADDHPRRILFSSLDDYLTRADAWRGEQFQALRDVALALALIQE